jgi:hypothetical protein
MTKMFFTFALLFATTSLWSQVEPSATGGGDLNDLHMMTPPPVSGDAYPVSVGAETRSNYVSGGIVFTAAYISDLLLQNGARSHADETYSFLPTIDFNRHTPRQAESLYYSSGFTLYQDTTELNGVSQNASAGYSFHLSPYAVIEVRDSFSQNYNFYNQGNPFSNGGVSGTPGTTGTVLIAPFENQLGNTSSAALEYQYGKNAMVGGTGSFSFLRYSDNSQSQGLSDGNTTSATGFYSRRIAPSEYVGVMYQFSRFVTHPIDTDTRTQTVFGFYTHYFTRSFSLSLLAGPERYITLSSVAPAPASWTPAVQASVGWQALKWNASANYSRIVSGAGGLVGSYDSDLGALSAQLLLSRNWTVGASGQYATFSNASPAAVLISPGGHTLAGTAYLQHRISSKLHFEAGYSHFHQGYASIPGIASSPDSNRVYASIGYGFNRPLGR